METCGNRLRVLFMHGLESGVGGSKDCYLRQHFEVLTPDMQMSVFRRDRANSVVNNMRRHPLFWCWVALAPATLLYAMISCGPMAWFAWLAMAVTTLWLLFRHAFSTSLERCIEIQTKAIKEFQPDIVVGSSWGGAVALTCAARGIYTGPLLALAPVPKKVLWYLGDFSGSRWSALCNGIKTSSAQCTVIVHGDADETVSIADSRSLASKSGATLIEIPGGDHRLNAALVDGESGRGSSDRLRQLVCEVAAKTRSGAVTHN